MLSALKNLKSKAKELVSTITHGQGVSKNIDRENCLPEKNALNPSYPYVNFGYMENGVFYQSQLAIKDKANLNISGVSGLPDEESWKIFQKHKVGKSHGEGDDYKSHINTLTLPRKSRQVVKTFFS